VVGSFLAFGEAKAEAEELLHRGLTPFFEENW
jgi:hypothetical protein